MQIAKVETPQAKSEVVFDASGGAVTSGNVSVRWGNDILYRKTELFNASDKCYAAIREAGTPAPQFGIWDSATGIVTVSGTVLPAEGLVIVEMGGTAVRAGSSQLMRGAYERCRDTLLEALVAA